ncbi:hypothetical protein Mgra_00002015 [Meloidogyne graminicola]|uniref:Amidinotransferase n=1 Tax=Meloidogyne graminicola TaxID=189291 RepID=A0A8S9ZYD7_9BILA|nr:hypothetical protein Mgra_00002015 [Meloidogyne graminicola]
MKKATNETIKKVLMVPPKYFTVKYSINPWMKQNIKVDKQKAMEQWNVLKKSIEEEGIKVLTLNQIDGQPDMVFACNSGLVYGNKIFLSKYRYAERTGEQKYFATFYKQLGLQLFGEDYPEYFEGGGDAVFSEKNILWAGWGGPRTDKKAYDYIRLMGDFEIIFCELIDPRFYHLDTCFCPVGINSALWFPPAFSAETREKIQNRLPKAIAVSEKEALNFVCNAINVRKKVISPSGVSKQTIEALNSLGYSLQEVEMNEFMKSGGACQCLLNLKQIIK